MATIIDFANEIDAGLVAGPATTKIPNSRFSEDLDVMNRAVATVFHQVQVFPAGHDGAHSANLSYELASARIRFVLGLTAGQADDAAAWSAATNLAAAMVAASKPSFFEDLASVFQIVTGGEIDTSEMTRDGDVLSQDVTVTVALTP